MSFAELLFTMGTITPNQAGIQFADLQREPASWQGLVNGPLLQATLRSLPDLEMSLGRITQNDILWAVLTFPQALKDATRSATFTIVGARSDSTNYQTTSPAMSWTAADKLAIPINATGFRAGTFWWELDLTFWTGGQMTAARGTIEVTQNQA